jgi:hypothetical protein
MPVFNQVEVSHNVEVSYNVDIEFEVYCGTCGAGLCQESDTRNSRRRSFLQVTVNACPICMSEKNEEIDNLKDEIKDLLIQISQLENQ